MPRLADCDAALRSHADKVSAYWTRAEVYYEQKNYGKALSDLQRAHGLNPKDRSAEASLAWFLATCPDRKLRNGQKAVALATDACQRCAWKEAADLDTLAAAYADRGQFDLAVDCEEKALKVAAEDEKEDFQSPLERYMAGKPFRGPKPWPAGKNRE